jgi:hypothetical protein
MVFDPTTFVITEARAVMETHPHDLCRAVEPHYDKLVGLSIARGFSAKVRELFGGPRGCSHVTALLLAMAPVAIQSMFSMNMGAGQAVDAGRGRRDDGQRAQWHPRLLSDVGRAADGRARLGRERLARPLHRVAPARTDATGHE